MFFISKPFIIKTALILGLIFFILDRLIKYLFYHDFLASSFLFSYTKNYGAVFGLKLSGILLILFYIILVLVMFLLINWIIKSWHKQKYLVSLALWFVLLGAASNIIDRLKFGFVIDYINLNIWPVFNLADMMITGGIIILIIETFKELRIK